MTGRAILTFMRNIPLRLRKRLVPLAAALAAGCTAYVAEPLNNDSINRALALPPAETIALRARQVEHPLLRPVAIDLNEGITPEQAGVLAVLISPSLRSERDRRSLASAQLIQAKLLPNPQLDLVVDPVTGGNTLGTSTGYNVGVSWDFTSLISHGARVAAAEAQSRSVHLDVAWMEWLTAEAAKKSAYDLLSLQAQEQTALEIERRLTDDLNLVRRAVDAHQKTLLDLAAAESAARKAHADLLALRHDLRHQELAVKQAIGMPSDATLTLRGDVRATWMGLPDASHLLEGIEDRRLDLVALRHGYESQEQTVRAATLTQFPKIVLNVHQGSDTTNVHTTGMGATVDLPIFDQNQGSISIEQATRRKLFDEYAARLFDARASVALAVADVATIRDQIADADDAIPSLRKTVDTYQQAVAQGNIDLLTYYSVASDLASKQMDALKLRQQLLQAKIALEIAAGESISDGGAAEGPSSGPAAPLPGGITPAKPPSATTEASP